MAALHAKVSQHTQLPQQVSGKLWEWLLLG
jgi:hypothetical protein